MADELLTYYERELTFVRRMAADFAAKYPRVASRLQLEPTTGQTQDPHVERLIEAFAYLTARVHLKIDDEFPEITESILQILYPHYLAPIPSMTIVQFEVDPEQGKLSTGYEIKRHQKLYTRPSGNTTCRFRTCYPVCLWPLDVAAVSIETPGPADASGRTAPAALNLTVRAYRDVRLSQLDMNDLRLFLHGEGQLPYRIYELIFAHCTDVVLRRPGAAALSLGRDALAEAGFGKDEGMLPYSDRSFVGYRLLQEYFHFPAKFLFFDVQKLGALRAGGFENEVTITLLLDAPPPFEQKIEPQNFRLGCTPVINLFDQPAEPIRLDHAHTEYHVIADVRRQRTTEVYSIDSVASVSPATGTSVSYQPFYSFKHSFDRARQQTFWHAARRASTAKDDAGTEVYLTLVDLDFLPSRPASDVVTLSVTCTNRDLPAALPIPSTVGDFSIEGAAPVRRIKALMKPTGTVRPPLRHGAQWRLISHLSLNFLSAVDDGGVGSPEILREILKLYDFSDAQAVQAQILGLAGVKSRQVWRRIRTDRGSGFSRGIETTLEFDESKYVGTGVFLFASILEKFLGLYVSINAFSETVATTAQRGLLKRWPARAGYQPLL
jgi:type VI secretion system protein ImpG